MNPSDHSGLHLPWLRSPQAHDYHHKVHPPTSSTLDTYCQVGAANYGNFSRVLDTLHGTDARYRASGQDWRRHRRLLTLSPAQSGDSREKNMAQ